MNIYFGISNVKDSNGDVILTNGNNYICPYYSLSLKSFYIEDNKFDACRFISKDSSIRSFYFDKNKLYFSKDNTIKPVGKYSEKFVSLLKQYPFVDVHQSGICSAGIQGETVSDFGVFLFDLNFCEEIKTDRLLPFSLVTKELGLASQSVRKGVSFLSSEFKEKWFYSSRKQVTLSSLCIPYEYEEFIIAYLGGEIERVQNESFTINNEFVALGKGDGVEVWKTSIHDRVTHVAFIKDTLYVACTDKFHLIDANSGSVFYTQCVKSVFSNDNLIKDLSLSKGLCYGDSKYVYYYNLLANALLIYSKTDQTLIRRVDLANQNNLIIDLKRMPKTINGKHYFEMISSYSMAGHFMVQAVLEIDPDDIHSELSSDIEKAPVFERSTFDDGKGHGYFYDVDHHNIHDILRFGRMMLNENLAYECRNIYQSGGVTEDDYNFPTDKAFTGNVVLRVKEKSLVDLECSEEIMDSMIDELSSKLHDSLFPESGAKLQFSWQYS